MRSPAILATLCLSVVSVSACTDAGRAPTTPSAAAPTAPAAHFTEAAATHLLVCPTTDGASTIGLLGPFGGVLSLGGNALELPFDAVPNPTQFQIVVPPSQYMEVDVHAVGLTTFLFQQPATITIDYSRCSPDAIPAGAQLHAVYIDSDTKAILQDMGGTIDSAAHRITFTTGHLSGYGVAY
jgi:hypothetical protein